jgi:hypothetical protein
MKLSKSIPNKINFYTPKTSSYSRNNYKFSHNLAQYINSETDKLAKGVTFLESKETIHEALIEDHEEGSCVYIEEMGGALVRTKDSWVPLSRNT